jgi:hypothetical protein
MGLPSWYVELWQGRVFVNALQNPELLAPTLLELEARLTPWNISMTIFSASSAPLTTIN